MFCVLLCLACSAKSTCVAQEKPLRKPACPLLSSTDLTMVVRMVFSKILRKRQVNATGLLLEMYLGSFPCFGIGAMTDVFHLLGVKPVARHVL